MRYVLKCCITVTISIANSGAYAISVVMLCWALLVCSEGIISQGWGVQIPLPLLQSDQLFRDQKDRFLAAFLVTHGRGHRALQQA